MGVCVWRVGGGGRGVEGGLSKTCTTETVPGSKTRPTLHGVCGGGGDVGGGTRFVKDLHNRKQSLVARRDLPYLVGGGGGSKTCLTEMGPDSKTRSTIHGVCVLGGGGGGGGGGEAGGLSKTCATETIPVSKTRSTIHGGWGGRWSVKDLHTRNGP